MLFRELLSMVALTPGTSDLKGPMHGGSRVRKKCGVDVPPRDLGQTTRSKKRMDANQDVKMNNQAAFPRLRRQCSAVGGSLSQLVQGRSICTVFGSILFTQK